jgi:signal transduction histidine kinase
MIDCRFDGALAEPGSREVLLKLAPKAETNRTFFALNERIDRLAFEVADRKRAEALIAAQNEVLEAIACDEPLPSVLRRLVLAAEGHAVGEMLGSVLLVDEDGAHLRHGAAPSLPQSYNEAIDGLAIGPATGSCGTAAFTGDTVVVEDIATHPFWSDFRELAERHGLRACWSTPILSADGRVVGTFAMYYREPRSPSVHDLEVIRFATRTAAVAIGHYRTHQRVRTLMAQQSSMLDGLPASIALLDGGGTIRSVNQSWEEWRSANPVAESLGVGSTLLEGCDEAFHVRTEEPTLTQVVSDVLSGKRGFTTFHCRSGDVPDCRWYKVSVAPIARPSGPQEAVIMHVDITEAKRAEQALERQAAELAAMNAELQQFAYVASHDLREPLRTVKSFAQLFVRRYDQQLGPEASQYLSYIEEGVTRMDNLLEDLLLYSRVSHSAELQRSTVDLTRTLATVLRSLHAVIEESGAVIRSENLPVVDGFPGQLAQLLQNLIANAIKYRGTSTPEIVIKGVESDEGWQLSVSDNGIGIEPAYHQLVFGLFKRLHARTVPGTGIGLAVCKKIVEAHGGRIWVESRAGQGATFHFTLCSKQPVSCASPLAQGGA